MTKRERTKELLKEFLGHVTARMANYEEARQRKNY